ncbi:MAG: DEAD/DEAH box helicase [Clostridia bacterium]|nr:DEAD/DEAH box helicase [Clostridia bacterium]
MKNFEELNLSNELLKALHAMNFTEMTKIQEEAIPVILEDNDVIGQSQTGTGKTAAFGIPAVESADGSKRETQVLILAPTRELATQIAEVINQLARFKRGVRAVAIYGGDSMERQIKDLKKGSQIVIGTPGRIMDHLRRSTLKLGSLKTVILDEADEMLNMGFEEDIQTILKDIDYPHQTLLFSATMPRKILEITQKYQTAPKHIKIKAETLTVKNIEQVYYETKAKMKTELLRRILKLEQPNSAVIFCNTKKKADELLEVLKEDDVNVDVLHGDIRQSTRERIMKKFKAGKINILIATDVAARGIDVDNLDLVINYDLPQEQEYYVHRIGRTGRNGKSGKAISFVVGKELRNLKEIERYAKTKIKALKAPTVTDIAKITQKERYDKIKSVIGSQEFSDDTTVTDLFYDGYSYEEIAHALYAMLFCKSPKVEKEKYHSDENGMVKLFLTVGKRDRIAVKDIIGAITSQTTISGKDIGKVILLDSYSFVDIPEEFVEEVMEGMQGKQIKGRNVKFEIAEK